MATIKCPHCGSPATIRGSRWVCGYCGDFGGISSLSSGEQARLIQSATPTVQVTITVADTSGAEESPHPFSRAELEDMVRRWDFTQNPCACRDLLMAAFPQAASRWSEEELAEMHTMDFVAETGAQDPQTALQMVKLLLHTAEGHLQEEETASQLLGWDLYDLLVSDDMLPLLVEELKDNGRLARQLFQSAYVDRPQEEILNACGRMGEHALQEQLLALLRANPFPHDPPELDET